jgi:hypothetical protein
MRRGAGLIEIATAVCAAVVAIATLAPGAAQATTREFAIHRGVTTIDMRVRHTTGTRPPAIVFSTRPGRLSCRVLGYHYGNLNRAGRFALRLRCSGVPRRARGRLVFRAPFVRSFPLHNGGNAVRVRIDEPRGNARPLGELTTGARNHACRVTRTSSRTFEGQFIASARVGCRGLRVKTRGTLAIGGLVAAVRVQAQPVSSRSARPSASITQSTAGAVAADSCDMVHQVVIPSQPTVLYKDCFGGPFRLGPWQSQFVGLGGPSFGCEPGWSRSVPALKAPAAWLLVGRTTVDLVTDPEDAWWYSYVRIAGLVTNWQFRGDITFRFTYRCFQVQ